jgi:hypothetical protein
MEKLKNIYRFLSGKHQTLHMEYKVNMVPRYGHGKPPHEGLYQIICANDGVYKSYLERFKSYYGFLHQIKQNKTNENDPYWENDFLPGLDIMAIYGITAEHKPKRYIEIGSGNSTKVVRKAIREQGLSTQVISVDPFPRAEIDHLSDEVRREPIENIKDYSFIIDGLEENDVLFIDNSHRVFPNSDATVCFLELLPKLKKGVLVHIHDIYLPFDYPQFMCDRFYNEQYVLAAFILANPDRYQTVFPAYHVSQNNELSGVIEDFWKHENTQNSERHGGSYWIQIG